MYGLICTCTQYREIENEDENKNEDEIEDVKENEDCDKLKSKMHEEGGGGW